MKKLWSCVLIILVLGGVVGIVLQNTNFKEDAPEISSVVELVTPAIAYADTSECLPDPLPPDIPDD